MKSPGAILIAFLLFAILEACSGTTVSVPTVTLPEVVTNPLQVCPIHALSEVPLAFGVQYFEELGENPSLLDDQEFLDEALADAEERLDLLIEKSQNEGPVCLEEIRTLQLEISGLEQHFWALMTVGNLEEAGKVDDLIIDKVNKFSEILASLKAGGD